MVVVGVHNYMFSSSIGDVKGGEKKMKFEEEPEDVEDDQFEEEDED